MKWIFSSISILVLLSACMSSPLENSSSPGRLIETPPYVNVPPTFEKDYEIIPIPTSASAVTGWLDEETILYIEEIEQHSILYAYTFHTGEKEILFEYDGSIVSIQPNDDYSLFAIQTLDEFDQAYLYVVDQHGFVQLKIDSFGESYSIYWNPYEQNQFLLVSYLPDWQYELFFVHVDEKKLTQLEAVQTYFQWISPTNVAFLDWSQTEPSYDAPLYELNVATGEIKKRQDDVIAFIGFPLYQYVTVTVSSKYDLHSMYTFYKENEPIHQLEMPILNTYSDQWWTPFHTFDSKNGIFYFLRPKYSSDYISYEDGYELVSFHLEKKKEVITEFTTNERIQLSPEGTYLLIGNHFDRLYHIESKQMFPLVR